MARLESPLCLLAMLVMGACTRPGTLPDDCRLASSEATWTTTAAAGQIAGEVTDRDAHEPVSNIAVFLADRDSLAPRARTDGLGRFRLSGIPEGRHVLVTRGDGYQRRVDTLMLLLDSGLRGTIALSEWHDVMRRCSLPLLR